MERGVERGPQMPNGSIWQKQEAYCTLWGHGAVPMRGVMRAETGSGPVCVGVHECTH